MSTVLNNGTVTFGDGTIQTTKTPTVTSAFTNDTSWTTSTEVAAKYATKAATGYTVTGGASRRFNLYTYSLTGEIGRAHV